MSTEQDRLELGQALFSPRTVALVGASADAAKLASRPQRVLRKHGYPPDKQEKATQTVLEQAEVIARDWAG